MPETQQAVDSVKRKRHVLIVEDEPINREILKMMLQDHYAVSFAADGQETFEAVRREGETLSLILLDLNLPDMHGLDVLRSLKADPQFRRIPVIVMTAEKDAEVECLTAGAIDFIPKPYPQPPVVLARILRTIELSEDRDIIRQTERDQLTGLYNREFFYRYAAQFDLYHKDQPADAIVLDIDHFHMINERYGKAAGDEVLKHVGANLREVIRQSGGFVSRREADTFLVYCPHRSDYEEILHAVSAMPDNSEAGESRIRLRMGVYACADKSIDIEQRFDRAKLAADTVKGSFLRSVGIYDESLHEKEVFAERLIESFPSALREKQFVVYYQPKYDIRPREPVFSNAEALVRWIHPELGMISPGAFIPLFEKNGLIQELDNYVWREAAAQIRSWKDRFGVTVPVSINVSRVDLYDPLLLDKLNAIVSENGITSDELYLEITESAYTEDSEQIIAKVNQLRSSGFRIEMDDFGTGYSSLNMISDLPVDALKLDMQFIRNAFKERKDTRLLEVVIQLAESLEIPTIAEGVETAEQMLTLKSMGCDIGQGYYFSRPLPAAEFEVFVREKKEHEAGEKKEPKPDGPDSYTYDALHDPLTGLYNHTAFDILFHDSDKDHIGVLIADIDDYSRIKEEHGSAYADNVAKKVGSVLRGNFRSVDDICRLREDEYVIIMTRITGHMRSLVFDKVELVNSLLQKGDDDMVPLSLSVGVAFSDRENPEGDIFHDADTALNRVKEFRHCGCVVF